MARIDSSANGTLGLVTLPPSIGESCKVCDDIEKLFTEKEVKIQLRSRTIRAQVCTYHNPLLQWIETKYNALQVLERDSRIIRHCYPSDSFNLRRDDAGIPWIGVLDYKSRERARYQVLLQGDNSKRSLPETAWMSTLDPKWTDLSLAKLWMERCTTEHASRCQSHTNSERASPAWLIDTKDECLVPGETDSQFVALSYRWGSSKARQMDLQAFKNMTVPGRLTQHSPFITPTVKHAIDVVRSVGERYLWVDALCIAPGDHEKMAEQLQLMGAIYASATLTIVALDGDAMSGLEGLDPLPRKLDNIFNWRNGTRIVLRNPPPFSATSVGASEYFQRGWTYQEFLLSRRRLIFGHQQLHWRCACSTWHEDQPNTQDSTDGEIQSFLHLPHIEQGWPDFSELSGLLREYNNRELSYPEDAFPGINGLLTYLGSSFKGGFLFGLPRAAFDAALMWHCRFGNSNLNGPRRSGLCRRNPSDRNLSILPDAVLPSWSWIGWRGHGLSMLEDEAQYLWSDLHFDPEYPKGCVSNSTAVVTLPITQWFGHETRDWETKYSISHGPEAEYHTAEKGKTTLFDTKTWTQREFISKNFDTNGREIIVPWGVDGKYVYEHVEFPGVHLWRPLLPLGSAEAGASTYLGQYPFISCKTRRARFGAVQHDDFRFEVSMDVHLSLYDRLGRLCGWVQLPNNEEAEGFPRIQIEENPGYFTPLAKESTVLNEFPEPDKLLELVAICLRKFPKHWLQNGHLEYIDFYGVLWVEWIDGIAYRRGCGYVAKQMWDEQDVEPVWLKMG